MIMTVMTTSTTIRRISDFINHMEWLGFFVTCTIGGNPFFLGVKRTRSSSLILPPPYPILDLDLLSGPPPSTTTTTTVLPPLLLSDLLLFFSCSLYARVFNGVLLCVNILLARSGSGSGLRSSSLSLSPLPSLFAYPIFCPATPSFFLRVVLLLLLLCPYS